MVWVQGYELYGLLIEPVARAPSLSLSLSIFPLLGTPDFKGLSIPHIDSLRSLDLATH